MIPKRGALLALAFLLALSYMISSASATNESEEIDYTLNFGNGSQLIQYIDGTTEFNLKSSIGIRVGLSSTIEFPSISQIPWWASIILILEQILKPILNFAINIIKLILPLFAPKIPIATEKAEEILKKIKGYLPNNVRS